MTTTWGVYNLQGKTAEGTHVAPDARSAVKWFVRWRVDTGRGVQSHKRTFTQKGYAKTFRSKLLAAQFSGWGADERGWPVDPAVGDVAPAPTTPLADDQGLGPTFEEYCNDIWYPTAKSGWSHKNRLGHRGNMRLAVELLAYTEPDLRVLRLPGAQVGTSIHLQHLVPDHVTRAIVERRQHNTRTAGVNARRLQAALNRGDDDITLLREQATPATVRSFYVTLSMILRSAHASGLIPRDPLVGTAKHAPKPIHTRVSQRIVPSIDEIFDLAEAIATLGPLGKDGRPSGERFRSLVLAAGTLGPRPGELVAHRPDWIEWDEPTIVRFHRTEGAIYDPEEGVRGRQVRALKHRQPEDYREVPALVPVADAIRKHLDRGYGTKDRTWTSVEGRALDWHNMMTVYWRPACLKVFGGSAKSQLASMTPSILRKAAITFWLDSDISPVLAADWAGHSEDVSRRYYAGRAAATYRRELERLAQTWTVNADD